MVAQDKKLKYLIAARRIFEHIAETADLNFCVQLWDGSLIPLGDNADPNFFISIKGPGVFGTILRKPTLENILLQYAGGGVDYHGGDLISFYETVRNRANGLNLSAQNRSKTVSKKA